MAYSAIITRIRNVRPHGNANKVQLGTCHGNQVVIGLDTQEGDEGIYFACDGQLSKEFCSANNLYRDSEQNKDSSKTGMFDPNGRVRAQSFRGQKSDGFWCPISNLNFIKGFDSKKYEEGYEFETMENVPVCSKYINPATLKIPSENQGKKTKRAKSSIMFKEHFDTGHLGKSLSSFTYGKNFIVTEKIHGTSSRIGHVLVEKNHKWYEKILNKLGISIKDKEWKYLNGTRRVVIEESKGVQFHDPTIRDKAFSLFNGNLRKGETVFCEIVGFESTGKPIMGSVDIKTMKDKEFEKRWKKPDGSTTMTYSYGCGPTECQIYVYRITLTNEDGQSIDYPWEDVKSRCLEIGVKHVPEIEIFTLDSIYHQLKKGHDSDYVPDDRDVHDAFMKKIDDFVEGPSLLDDSHIREGVCVRIEGSGFNNSTYKHKGFAFKIMEGIIKDSGVVDTEEAQG